MDIGVLYGGTSAEVEVSRKSGKAIADGLRKMSNSVTELEWTEQRAIADIEVLKKFDVIFIGYHGGAGEDGHIQAVLELAKIPFTGSGSVSSALGMNKILSKIIFDRAAIPNAKWCVLEKSDSKNARYEYLNYLKTYKLDFPVVIKPANQGSTVGITIAKSEEDFFAGVKTAFEFGKFALVERYIPGREVTVAILGDEPMPVVEIIPEGGFYDYEHKYTSGKSKYVCPAKISDSVAKKLQDAAIQAYKALGCRHYARADFRLSPDNEIFCLEVNTLPGMTDLSLVPMAAREYGIEFPELVHRIADMAKTNKGG